MMKVIVRKSGNIGNVQKGEMPIGQILLLALIAIPIVIGGIMFMNNTWTKIDKQAAEANTAANEEKNARTKLKTTIK